MRMISNEEFEKLMQAKVIENQKHVKVEYSSKDAERYFINAKSFVKSVNKESSIWQVARTQTFSKYRASSIRNTFATTSEYSDSCNVLLFSYPVKSIFEDYKNGKYPSIKRVVYDRTDFWGDEDDDILVKNADIVTCSSKWLYDHTDSTNKIYIPNRCAYQEWHQAEKYEKPTAIYAGRSLRKIDIDGLKRLVKNNPNINFEIYANDPIEGLEGCCHSIVSYDEIFEEMLKCHYGLLPLNDSDWAAGMNPLKQYQYHNAHLPVLYFTQWNGKCNVDVGSAFEISDDCDILSHSEFKFEDDDKEYDWAWTMKKIKPYLEI